MSELIHSTKIIPLNKYFNPVLDKNKKVKILKRSFEIMLESCRKHNSNSLFFKSLYNNGNAIIAFTDLGTINDQRYENNGCINGKGTYFTINLFEYQIKGTIFLECINGMYKYSDFGLQKYKEDVNSTYYYHILDGEIISSVVCDRKNNFLSDINNVKEINPFILRKKSTKYRIKRNSDN